MMAPSIWTEDFFDDFMRDFPFYDDREMKRMEKKLYGRRGKNVMKTDIQETDKIIFWKWICRDFPRMR